MEKSDKELAEELQRSVDLQERDREYEHMVADDFLTKLVRQLGFEEVANTYGKLRERFWYA